MRRPSGTPTAPFASLTASSQSPADAGAAQPANKASTPGEGAQRGPRFAISLETADLEINSAGAAALRAPDLPKLWPKAAKSRKEHSAQVPKRRAKTPACTPEKQPPDRRCYRPGASRSYRGTARHPWAPPSTSTVRCYPSSTLDVCVLPGPAHCGINTTARAQRKTAFLDREAWSQDTFR